MRDLSLHLMDIVQNSVKARATAIEIEIDARPDADQRRPARPGQWLRHAAGMVATCRTLL